MYAFPFATTGGGRYYIADSIEMSSNPEIFIQRVRSSRYFQYSAEGDIFRGDLNADNTILLSDYEL